MNFYLVSAKDGRNVDKMFHSIVDTILQIQNKKKKKF